MPLIEESELLTASNRMTGQVPRSPRLSRSLALQLRLSVAAAGLCTFIWFTVGDTQHFWP